MTGKTMKNPGVDIYRNKCWYNDRDEYHREDGPAIEWWDGDRWWYINGKLHREDGPAIEHTDGRKSWYYNGEWIGRSNGGFTQEDFERYLRSLKIKEYW